MGPENVIATVDELEMIVKATVDKIDQRQSNFDVILAMISSAIHIIRTSSFSDTDLGEVY